MVSCVTKLLCVFAVAKCACAVGTETGVEISERLRMLEERVEKQELDNTKHGETIRRLQQTCHRYEETISKQGERNKLQDDLIQHQEIEIQRLENRVLEVRRCQGNQTVSDTPQKADSVLKLDRASRQYERIAFTAYADHNLQNLGIDHPIIYNRIILNEGSAYNENSGMFTCPMDGIYVFYFSVSTQDTNQIVAKLVVDGANQVDGVSDTFHDNHEAQGGNFVTLSLQKGQQVWVANYRWTTHSMQESDIYRFSTFSGFWLY